MIPKAKVTVGHRQPEVRGRGLDDRHPQSRNPLPLPRLGAEGGRGGQGGHAQGPRGLAAHPADHHRPARRQGPRRRGLCRAGHRPEECRRPHRLSSPSPTSRPMSAPARRSTARPICAAIRSISPTASCRCCPSASRTSSARSRKARTAPRSPCAWFRRRGPQEAATASTACCSARPPSSATSRRRRPSTAGPTTRPARCSSPSCSPLWAAYDTMAKARDKRGPLDLDLPERKIILDAKGMVADIRIPERLEAHAAHRGDDDRRQCRGRRNAGEAQDAPCSTASTTRPAAKSCRRCATSSARSICASTSPTPCAPVDFNRILAKARKAGKIEQVSRDGAALARRRPSTPPRTTAISASTSTATPTSPRPSAAMPTSSSTAR